MSSHWEHLRDAPLIFCSQKKRGKRPVPDSSVSDAIDDHPPKKVKGDKEEPLSELLKPRRLNHSLPRSGQSSSAVREGG